MLQALEQDPMAGEKFPKTPEEKDQVLTQVIQMLHSPQIQEALQQTIETLDPAKVVEVMAMLSTSFTMKVVMSIEESTGRDIDDQGELAILSIVTEELYTMATRFGFKATKDLIGNTLEIAAQSYNQQRKGQGAGQPQGAPQGAPQAPQGPPQQPQGQGVLG